MELIWQYVANLLFELAILCLGRDLTDILAWVQKDTRAGLRQHCGPAPLRNIGSWLVWLSGLSADCEPRGHWFDSWSGRMPELRARSPVGDMQEQPHINVSLPFFLFPFPSL